LVRFPLSIAVGVAAVLAGCADQSTDPSGQFPLGSRPKPTDALALQQTVSCVLDQDGAVYCWGLNTAGVFGTGDTVSSMVPRSAAGGMRFVKLGIGRNFACGLAPTAAVYCWGDGGNGQLGTGSTASSLSPVPITGGHKFQSISVGYNFACGIELGTHRGYC
jgi:hypothetical protein